jgi:hypothetical protein
MHEYLSFHFVYGHQVLQGLQVTTSNQASKKETIIDEWAL